MGLLGRPVCPSHETPQPGRMRCFPPEDGQLGAVGKDAVVLDDRFRVKRRNVRQGHLSRAARLGHGFSHQLLPSSCQQPLTLAAQQPERKVVFGDVGRIQLVEAVDVVNRGRLSWLSSPARR